MTRGCISTSSADQCWALWATYTTSDSWGSGVASQEYLQTGRWTQGSVGEYWTGWGWDHKAPQSHVQGWRDFDSKSLRIGGLEALNHKLDVLVGDADSVPNSLRLNMKTVPFFLNLLYNNWLMTWVGSYRTDAAQHSQAEVWGKNAQAGYRTNCWTWVTAEGLAEGQD